MKRTQIDMFEKLNSQLQSLYKEMSALSAKSPNAALNTFKIKFVNTTLTRCNTLLDKKYRPFEDFEQFSVDELPSNSDVTFILSQYIVCLEELRADNIVPAHGLWIWKSSDGGGEIRTGPPKKLIEKG